jgi:hypothetical protein
MNVTAFTPSASASHRLVRKIQNVCRPNATATATRSAGSPVIAPSGPIKKTGARRTAAHANARGSARERSAATPYPPKKSTTSTADAIRARWESSTSELAVSSDSPERPFATRIAVATSATAATTGPPRPPSSPTARHGALRPSALRSIANSCTAKTQ